MSRQTQAIIHLDKIKQNYQLANQWAPRSKNIAIIKADAYGHGLLKVADYLQPHVAAFGVAIIDEALALRQAGISKNILVLQGVNEAEELQSASEANLWLSIHHPSQVELILRTELKKPIKLWLKLDSGMHRLGISPQQYPKAIDDLLACAWVDPALVLSTHFSCAGDLRSSISAQQLDVFNQLIASQVSCQNLERSLANSAALASIPESHADWNRPGIMLYGLPLFEQSHASDKALQASMTFNTQVIAVRQLKKGECVGYSRRWQAQRESRIATLAVGYADGYPRQAKDGTPVYIRGKLAPLVGHVSMDLISIDVTDIPQVQIGDKAELWGEHLSANRVAEYADTIGYDLITGVSQRVKRIYIKE